MATRIARYMPPASARRDGASVGRSAVPADVAAIRPQPVVVRRELVVEQLVGEASAAPILAVAPQALLVEAPAAGQLRVSWTGTGAGAYKLWHQTVASYDAAAADAKWMGVTAVDVSGTGPRFSHTLPGLTGGTEYYVAVSAVVGTTESPRSPLVAARALYAAPAAPTNPKTTLSTTVEGRIRFEWDAVANADLYYPEVQLPGSTEFVSLGLPTANLYQDYLGVVASTYTFRVRADRRYAVDGAYSASVTATPVLLAPAKPAKPVLSTTRGVNAGLTLTFTDAERADAHDGEYRVVGAAAWTLVEDVSSPWAFIGAVGSQYEARVKGTRTGTADGPWSDASNRVTAVAASRMAARDASKDIALPGRQFAYANVMTTDGTTLWYAEAAARAIQGVALATRMRDTAKDFSATELGIGAAEVIVGIATDGTTMWVVMNSGASVGRPSAVYRIEAFTLATKARDAAKSFTFAQIQAGYPAAAGVAQYGRGSSVSAIATDGTTLWSIERSSSPKVTAWTIATKAGDPAKRLSNTVLTNAVEHPDIVDLATDGTTLWAVHTGRTVYGFDLATRTAALGKNFGRSLINSAISTGLIRGAATDGATMWLGLDLRIYAFTNPT